MNSNKLTSSTIALFALVIIVTSFTSGFFIGKQSGIRESVPPGEGKLIGKRELLNKNAQDVNFSMFWDVWDFIKEDYYDLPVSDKDLFYGAMHGLVDGLDDPYSTFFNPDEATAFAEELNGSFEGIGAEIGIKDEQLQVVAPLADSPAEKAGLRSGDKILFIDGQDTASLSVEEAVKLIRGAKDTEVVLSITSDGVESIRDVKIIRDEITIDSVKWKMLDGDIALINIYFFNDDTNELFQRAVNEILTKNPSGIILDMRNNPGGLLNSAVFVSSAWVGDKTVVFEKIRDEKSSLNGSGAASLADILTVVLVNEGTASGSEIVAGALQDYNLAKIVGMQTYGKGSVQDYQTLPDGSAIKLTVAEWLTPSGRSINKQGITPDIIVEITDEDFYAEKDRQMEKAIEILGK